MKPFFEGVEPLDPAFGSGRKTGPFLAAYAVRFKQGLEHRRFSGPVAGGGRIMAEGSSQATIIDRALGAYLGYAVGDALGATVAHLTPSEIVLKYGVHARMVGGGWLQLKAGQVTDDTEMTLSVGRALIKAGGWKLPFVCDELATWLKGAPIDVGHTCRRGIRRYIVEGTMQATFSPGHAGNGALSRNLPVALATLGRPQELEDWTTEQCHITHHHPLSDDATLALGRMVQSLILTADVRAARAIARDLVRDHPVFTFERKPSTCSAYVVDTVKTVLHHTLSGASFRNGVISVVNTGGDADTAGALAGMLLGATCGASAIPGEWLKRLDPMIRAEITGQVLPLLAIAGIADSGSGPRGT